MSPLYDARNRPALRLCPDRWISVLLGDIPDDAERHRLRDPVEALQWTVAEGLFAQGIDVVLEWGLWSRAERDDLRQRAARLGHRSETIYLLPDRAELWTRLKARNRNLPADTFSVSREEFSACWTSFQPPTPDEPCRVAESSDRSTPSRRRSDPAYRRNRTPILFLTCGVQGSGKTTLARRLETDYRALRLTADDWLHHLNPSLSDAQRNSHRERLELVQWITAAEALSLGANVVLD